MNILTSKETQNWTDDTLKFKSEGVELGLESCASELRTLTKHEKVFWLLLVQMIYGWWCGRHNIDRSLGADRDVMTRVRNAGAWASLVVTTSNIWIFDQEGVRIGCGHCLVVEQKWCSVESYLNLPNKLNL